MENNNEESYGGERYTIDPKDIPAFVAGLRQIQEDMIEAVVESRATQGYPEARAVIDYIKGIK